MWNRSRILSSSLWLGLGVAFGWGASKWLDAALKQLLQLLWPLGPLKLERPLVTFDIEATGLNVTRDRILEIAAIKLMPDGTVQVKGPQRLNPGVPISAEVTAIHGISAADVADCPRFEEVAGEWRSFLEGCDLHGYNAKKFDVPMIRNEFRRCGSPNFPPLGVAVVDSFRIFCMQEPRSLGAAVRFYCGRSHDGPQAHTALADARATLSVLVQQVRRYRSLPRGVAGLADQCSRPSRAQDITGDGKFQWRGELPVLGFGKYQGEPLAVLMSRHTDYLRWMSGQDFSDESLIVVEQALRGLLPTRDGGWEPLVFEPAAAAAAAPVAPPAAQPAGQAAAQAAAAAASGAPAADATAQASSSSVSAGADAPQQPLPPSPQQQQQASSSSASQHSRRRGSRGSQPWQQQQQQQEAAAEAGPTGWPEVESPKNGHDKFSWAVDPAAEPAVESAVELAVEQADNGSSGDACWGSAAHSPDGWSIVDPAPQEPANPEPLHTQPEDAEEAAGAAAADDDDDGARELAAMLERLRASEEMQALKRGLQEASAAFAALSEATSANAATIGTVGTWIASICEDAGVPLAAAASVQSQPPPASAGAADAAELDY